jgi:hypothetical protein
MTNNLNETKLIKHAEVSNLLGNYFLISFDREKSSIIQFSPGLVQLSVLSCFDKGIVSRETCIN